MILLTLFIFIVLLLVSEGKGTFSIIGSLVLGIAISLSPERMPEYTNTTTPIYSISGNYNNITGYFVLGTGNINSEEQYSYFVKRGDSKFKEYIPTQGTAIIETNTSSPSVIRIDCQPGNGGPISWTNSPLPNATDCKNYPRYEIIVPEHSVIKTFNIN